MSRYGKVHTMLKANFFHLAIYLVLNRYILKYETVAFYLLLLDFLFILDVTFCTNLRLMTSGLVLI